MCFQVVDDVLDLTASDEALGKPAGQDLVEGIYTLPVIYALAESDELRALLGGPLDGARRDQARSLATANGAVDAALRGRPRPRDEGERGAGRGRRARDPTSPAGFGASSTASSAERADRQHLPLPGYALERLAPAVLELDPRAGDEVAHRPGHEDLLAVGQRRDARSDVDRDPREIVAAPLALAGVDARRAPRGRGPPRASAMSSRAPDRARRAVERREEPVAGRLDLVAAVLRERLADRAVVLIEQLTPAPVAEARQRARSSRRCQ